MPRTYRRRKTPLKKRRRKKPPQASTAVARIGYSSGLNFLPDKFIAKMKWNKSFILGAGTTDVATIQHFSLTGLFDPEVAVGTSLQPYGFDQLMTYYAHYMVLGAKAKIRFIHKAGNPMTVGAISSADTVTSKYSARDDFINDPQARYAIVHNEKSEASVSPPGYSKRRVFGVTKDEELTGNASANPSENYYVSTYLINSGPGDSQASCVMVVEIEYTALFSERVILSKS